VSETMRRIVRPALRWRPGRALARDPRGSTLIEFAAVAAPFIALIFANLVTALALFSQQILDTTTEKMARRLMTGQEHKASTRQSAFRTKVCDDLPSYMTCDRVMVEIRKAASFAALPTASQPITYNSGGAITNTWKYEPGKPGDIVVMQVYYRWPSLTGPLGFTAGTLPNGERLLVSTAIFKTEQYE